MTFVVQLGLVPQSLSSLRSMPLDEVLRLKFGESEVVDKLISKYAEFWGPLDRDPRDEGRSEGLHMVRHYKWFEVEDAPWPLVKRLLPHLHFSAPESHLKALFRFRLGCCGLRVHDFNLHHVRRSERTCRLCHTGGVEDERHVIFECPRYASLRGEPRWLPLFSAIAHGDVRAFINQVPQYNVAGFIYRLLRFRNEELEIVRRFDSQPGLDDFEP